MNPSLSGFRSSVRWGALLFAAATLPVQAGKPAPVTVFAAGDIADCRNDGARQTSRLLDDPAAYVLAIGDLVYPNGTSDEFRRCYGPTWGRHRSRTFPVPGNHEYFSRAARPYFDYFPASSGPHGSGYYSFDLGAWHAVALNSNIPTDSASRQYGWLKEDLERNPTRCVLALIHHPRFSSGVEGDTAELEALWALLQQHRVTLVLSGHDHQYERLAPMDAKGNLDLDKGIRSFVVGTGGAPLDPARRARPNSEIRNNTTWGVLRLDLYANGYAWEFVAARGQGFRDWGAGHCRERD